VDLGDLIAVRRRGYSKNYGSYHYWDESEGSSKPRKSKNKEESSILKKLGKLLTK
jgi:hypothetical protein